MKTLVVTHSADFDGKCSEAIARRALGDTATYHPYDYRDEVPDLTPYDRICLIDVSFPRDVMIQCADRIVWIDHHISKMRELDGVFIPGYRIDGVAACRLAWQWFTIPEGEDPPLPTKEDYVNRTVSEPCAVQLLGEYDIWDKRNSDVDTFQLGLAAESVVDWSALFAEDHDTGFKYVEAILGRGRAIQAYVKKTNLDIVRVFGFDIQWEGLNLLALNTSKSSSLIFEGAIRPEHDALLAYRWDGKMWRASLYGVPGKDIDLSVIAGKHGGGGHRKAAGFALNELPPAWGRGPSS